MQWQRMPDCRKRNHLSLFIVSLAVGNQLGGTIPTELGLLTQLTGLSLRKYLV